MYHNTGAVIKVLATILAILMMIGCVAVGLYYIIEFEEIEVGLPIMIGGCFVSWLSCLMMAAFGELVNNTHKILKLLKTMSREMPAAVIPQPVPEYVPAARTEYSAPAVSYPKAEYAPAPRAEYASPVAPKAAPAARPVKRSEPSFGTSSLFEQPSDNDLGAGAANCPTCGTPRKGDNAFCAFCGTKF